MSNRTQIGYIGDETEKVDDYGFDNSQIDHENFKDLECKCGKEEFIVQLNEDNTKVRIFCFKCKKYTDFKVIKK